MGYYKKLAIIEQEQQLAELYENYHIEQIVLQAEQRKTTNRLMYEELLLNEQLKLDKEENQ